MIVEIRNCAGVVVASSHNMSAVLTHANKFSYVVLWAEGKTLNVRFGTGENPDTCVYEFDNADVLKRWIASRLYNSRGKMRGEFITRDRFNAMEAANARYRD
jgi:hypothetical protein